MSKYLRFAMALVIVALTMCSPAYAVYTGIPSVTMAFDPATFIYTYTVVQPADAADTLTDFAVLGFTTMDDPYVMTNPVDGYNPTGSPPGWWNSLHAWSDPGAGQSGTEYRWSHGGVRKAYSATLPWTGIFKLQMLGTQPVPGLVTTMGASMVINSYSVDVPGIVPEPSSLLALGGMLIGVGPLMLRFRKKHQ